MSTGRPDWCQAFVPPATFTASTPRARRNATACPLRAPTAQTTHTAEPLSRGAELLDGVGDGAQRHQNGAGNAHLVVLVGLADIEQTRASGQPSPRARRSRSRECRPLPSVLLPARCGPNGSATGPPSPVMAAGALVAGLSQSLGGRPQADPRDGPHRGTTLCPQSPRRRRSRGPPHPWAPETRGRMPRSAGAGSAVSTLREATAGRPPPPAPPRRPRVMRRQGTQALGGLRRSRARSRRREA